MPANHRFDAVLAAPFGTLGVRLAQGRLVALEFLPPETPLQASANPFLRLVERAFLAYWADPQAAFDLPLAPQGSAFRLRVWQMLGQIPSGTTWTYGELARRLGSSPRAVGQALGDNPLPIVIPCHRVVSASGDLGGFNHSCTGFSVDIKRWLLTHEGVL